MGHESYDRRDAVKGSTDRTFGLFFGGVFLLVAVYPLFVGGELRLWSIAVAALFVAVALLRPQLLRPLNRAWMLLGLLLHKIVTPIVLGLLYLAVITPVALVMRIKKRDVLRLRFDPNASSYWVDREPPGPSPETINHQF